MKWLIGSAAGVIVVFAWCIAVALVVNLLGLPLGFATAFGIPGGVFGLGAAVWAADKYERSKR